MHRVTRSPLLWSIVLVGLVACAFMSRYFIFDNGVRVGRGCVEQGDLDGLQRLLEDYPGASTELLAHAFMQDKKDIFDYLLNHGADPRKCKVADAWGWEYIIHVSAEREDGYWLDRILEKGGDPNQPGHRKRINPLTYAIQSKHPHNALKLIRAGADPKGWGGDRQSLLSFAFEYQQYEVAWELLKRGADINPENYIVRSLVYRLQQEFGGFSEEELNSKIKSFEDSRSLQKILDWFDEQRLDWRNATYDESKQRVPQKWIIPRLPDED